MLQEILTLSDNLSLEKGIIGIFGGIGAGKSMVSRILRLLGRRVYDCDYRAKVLMEEEGKTKQMIVAQFGIGAYKDGRLDRKFISEIIFRDEKERERLNGIVHKAVREEILALSRDGLLFVESAIPVTSGLAQLCNQIWYVTASKRVRVERAVARGGISEEEVLLRIDAQKGEEEFGEVPVVIISNE